MVEDEAEDEEEDVGEEAEGGERFNGEGGLFGGSG